MALNDDASLILRAQRGDTGAYESLVHAYEQTALRAAWLLTRDEEEAADTAQEAFVRAYRALGSFTRGQPFRPWLLRIVTNLALNRLKAKASRERMTERYTRQLAMNEQSPTPEQAAAEREQNERLMQAVRGLAPDEQVLISLRYFMELAESEVAQTLNIPPGTVKSRLHRTLTRLREIIARDYPDLRDSIAHD